MRELRGKRAVAKSAVPEHMAGSENVQEIRQNTLHNPNMDRKIENFNKLIQFVACIPEYKSNETYISVTGLNNKLAEQKSLTAGYLAANAALDSARLERNTILYSKKYRISRYCIGC